jgi:hypothetical protein
VDISFLLTGQPFFYGFSPVRKRSAWGASVPPISLEQKGRKLSLIFLLFECQQINVLGSMLKELIIVSEFHGPFFFFLRRHSCKKRVRELLFRLSSQQKGPKLGVIFYCFNTNNLKYTDP